MKLHSIFSFWLFSLILQFDLFSMNAYAQDYPKKFTFRNIMQNQDIALGEVEAIIQDHEGFIWLGGRNALLRYDGYEFLSIPIAGDDSKKNGEPVLVKQVVELFEDSHQQLWISTRNGLYKYDREHEVARRLNLQDGKMINFFNDRTLAVSETPTGEILVGTYNGLIIVNPVTHNANIMAHIEGDANSLPNNTVRKILIDKQGVIWLGTDAGLVRMEWPARKMTLILPYPSNPTSLPDNAVRAIAQDHNGDLWVGVANGLNKFNPHTATFKRYQNDPGNHFSLAQNFTRDVFVDKNGWVWSGSDTGGLSLYDVRKDQFIRFQHEEGQTGSLSSNTIRRIFQDNAGDMWVGTYPSGVNFHDRLTEAISVYRKDGNLHRGLLENSVESVLEDNDGNLWVGAGGVTRYNPANETFIHYQKKTDGIVSTRVFNSISAISARLDLDGDIWFGSWGNGYHHYNSKTDSFEQMPFDASLSNTNTKTSKKLIDSVVWGIFQDKQKNLWLSTHNGGLGKYDKKTGIYTNYEPIANDSTSISSTLVWTVFEDSTGRFWVVTANGLNLMDRDKGTFKHYMANPDDIHSLSNNLVLSIFEDKKRRLWIGTDSGLHLYHSDTNNFSRYSTKDGFVDGGIRAITEDQLGNLWLGTNNGIVMFNADSNTVRNYMRYNGEIIGGVATGAALTTRKGEIVFGTKSGLYIFDVNKLITNEKIPPVVLTDFRIFTKKIPVDGPDKILNKVINQTDQITLDYTKSMISFNFAALNYRDSDKNQYAYKLEGFDDRWREVGNQRTAIYTNLDAGHYNFRIKASNNDGVWNNAGKSIKVNQLPPPWKTWWAYILYVLALSSLVIWFIFTQRKLVRILEEKVRQRTAELEAISFSDPLTGTYNRRYLLEYLPTDVARIMREHVNFRKGNSNSIVNMDISFFMVDIDYFKSVNDMYGHAAGDQVLVQFASLLKATCRQSDLIVRWGGEEFLIVSRFSDRSEAKQLAERLRKCVEVNVFNLPNGNSLNKTCSIGYASFPFIQASVEQISWEEIVELADHAAYVAKRSGRNRTIGFVANKNTKPSHLSGLSSGYLKELVDGGKLRILAVDDSKLIWE